MSTYSVEYEGLSFEFESATPLPCQLQMGDRLHLRWNKQDYLLVVPVNLIFLMVNVTPVIEITEEDAANFLFQAMVLENGEG